MHIPISLSSPVIQSQKVMKSDRLALVSHRASRFLALMQVTEAKKRFELRSAHKFASSKLCRCEETAWESAFNFKHTAKSGRLARFKSSAPHICEDESGWGTKSL